MILQLSIPTLTLTHQTILFAFATNYYLLFSCALKLNDDDDDEHERVVLYRCHY